MDNSYSHVEVNFCTEEAIIETITYSRDEYNKIMKDHERSNRNRVNMKKSNKVRYDALKTLGLMHDKKGRPPKNSSQ